MSRKTLRKRTTTTWIDQIRGLPKAWRGDVARVVWWDFFSDRLVSDRIPEWDEYLRPPFVETSAQNVARGLERIGYETKRIKSRLSAYLPRGAKK